MRSKPAARVRLSPRTTARAAAILVPAALVLWVVFASTFAVIVRERDPLRALSMWSDSETKALAAFALVQENQSPETLARAKRLAVDALRREPVNAAAARTLALITDIQGRTAAAERLFAYTERLSRRDLPTQLWLIESNIRRNDIAGALRHYDKALRTSRDSRGLLIPILVRASADPAITVPLGRLVAGRPPWWSIFAEALVSDAPSPRAQYHIIRGLGLDADDEAERLLLARTLARLVDAGLYAQAHTLYRESRPGNEQALVRNGAFETGAGELPPFDWQLTDEPDLGAYRQPVEARSGDMALVLVARSGRGGEVGRQLLGLPAGTYRIGALAGGSVPASSRPSLVMACAQPSRELLRIRLAVDADGARSAGQFTIPAAGCPAQWLRLEAMSSDEQADSTLWVDSVEVRPL